MEQSPGAAGYRVSNPAALLAAALKASLDVSYSAISCYKNKSLRHSMPFLLP